MPKNPKSTKFFGPRAVGFMVTDTAGNQQVIPFIDSEERLAPTNEQGGIVPPLPDGGSGDVFILVFNDITNTYEWTEATTIVTGGAVIPLVDGSEPPNLVSDGAGNLIVIDYEP
jgi:hypothetical protein